MPAPAAPAVTGARGLAARLLVAATAGYAGVLVYATHHPRPRDLLAGATMPPDKWLHFLAYGLLGLLVALTLAATRSWSPRVLVVAVLLLVAFATADESTQRWFGRHADVMDWLADGLGIGAGIAAGALVRMLVRWCVAAGRRRAGGPRGGGQ